MIYSLRSKKTGKNILRLTLLIVGLGLCVSAAWITWILLILGVYLIISVFLIRDKEIAVYADRFELIGISWIPRLNSKEVFNYIEIQKVQFDERYTNLISEILFDTVFTPVTSSKPDTIEIKLKDGRMRIINRIGKRKDFIDCFKAIVQEYYKYKQTI